MFNRFFSIGAAMVVFGSIGIGCAAEPGATSSEDVGSSESAATVAATPFALVFTKLPASPVLVRTAAEYLAAFGKAAPSTINFAKSALVFDVASAAQGGAKLAISDVRTNSTKSALSYERTVTAGCGAAGAVDVYAAVLVPVSALKATTKLQQPVAWNVLSTTCPIVPPSCLSVEGTIPPERVVVDAYWSGNHIEGVATDSCGYFVAEVRGPYDHGDDSFNLVVSSEGWRQFHQNLDRLPTKEKCVDWKEHVIIFKQEKGGKFAPQSERNLFGQWTESDGTCHLGFDTPFIQWPSSGAHRATAAGDPDVVYRVAARSTSLGANLPITVGTYSILNNIPL